MARWKRTVVGPDGLHWTVKRSRRRLPWQLVARTYPWGRRYPAVVLRYEVREHDYADWALDQLVDGLERGDGAPVLLGAERV